MGKYDKLIQKNDAAQCKVQEKTAAAVRGMDEMAEDAERVASIYRDPESRLADIDASFAEALRFNKTDVAFLMLATALQVGRWVVVGLVNNRMTEEINDSRVDHNDQSVKDMEKERRAEFKDKHDLSDSKKSEKYRGWQNLALESVPYDITRGSKAFGINMEGGYHRIHTLGHDPVLGWIFGTMNIISDTITLDKTCGLRTIKVQMRESPKRWESEYSAILGFRDAFESIHEDPRRLPAAVFAQALHLKSDEYTKLGLPVPVLEAFAPDFASSIYKEGYDSLMLAKDIKRIGIQAASAAAINFLIASIHGLFYDSSECLSRELYEAKTRRILSISNIIASSSNVVAVAAMEGIAAYTENPQLSKDGWGMLDIGGILVTMHRLVSDTAFIRKVKAEYLEKEWKNSVVGSGYSFLSEAESE